MTARFADWTLDLATLTERAHFDAVEVHPVCRTDPENDTPDNTDLEVCEPDEAEMWSVYLHIRDTGITCIADRQTEAAALSYAHEIASSWVLPIAHGVEVTTARIENAAMQDATRKFQFLDGTAEVNAHTLLRRALRILNAVPRTYENGVDSYVLAADITQWLDDNAEYE